MSQLEVLPACSPLDFDFDVLACSPSTSPSFSRSYQENFFKHAFVTGLLSSPSHIQGRDGLRAPITTNTVQENNDRDDGEVVIPGLPPLLHGHPDTHLRNGVLQAARLAAAGEVDAEKAFFVADLSYVFRQQERWKKNLPEIEPFYGE